MHTKDIIVYLFFSGVKRDHIMLIDPPVVDERKTEVYRQAHQEDTDLLMKLSTRNLANTKRYSDACVDIAKHYRTGFVELFSNM